MKLNQAIATLLAMACIAMAASSWVTLADEANTPRSSADATFSFPRIKGHGKVVRFPNAADQPRAGSRICVDITAGGAPEKINPAIEKVARFVNIYAGAGQRSADVRITVILHGNATLTALNDEAYAKQFQTDRNPNLLLFKQLKDAAVEILVCGQSLAHNGQQHEAVASEVGVAVSALTVNVNRQQDGYAFIPLH